MRSFRKFFPVVENIIALPPNGVFVDRFRELDVRVVEIPLDHLSLSGFIGTRRLISALQPDVIHSHGKGAGLYARLTPRRKDGDRRVHSFHGFHPPSSLVARMTYTGLERMLAHRSDTFIAVSSAEAKDIQETLGTRPEAISVIPNIVDRTEIAIRAADPLDGRVVEFLSRYTNSSLIVMIGRDDAVKNYPLAIAACRKVAESLGDVVFIFVGLNRKTEMAANEGEKFGLRMLSIPFLENTAPLLMRADIVLLTSRKEGSPLVLLEALALGKPVVGTDVDGIQDVVTDGVNGLLAEESSDAVATQIERLVSDCSLYERLAENARLTGEAMDLKSWASQYHRVYSETEQH